MGKIKRKHSILFFFLILFFVVALKYLLEKWIFQVLIVFLVPLLMAKIFYLLGDFINETRNNSLSNFAKSFNFKKGLADKNLLKGLIFLKDKRNEKILDYIYKLILKKNITNKKIFNYIFKDENDVRYEIFNVSYTKGGQLRDNLIYTITAGRIVANINLPNTYVLLKDFHFKNLDKGWSKVESESNDFNKKFNLYIENYSVENQTKIREYFDPKMLEIFMDKKSDIYQIEIYRDSIIVYLDKFLIRYNDLKRLYNALQIIAKKQKK